MACSRPARAPQTAAEKLAMEYFVVRPAFVMWSVSFTVARHDTSTWWSACNRTIFTGGVHMDPEWRQRSAYVSAAPGCFAMLWTCRTDEDRFFGSA